MLPVTSIRASIGPARHRSVGSSVTAARPAAIARSSPGTLSTVATSPTPASLYARTAACGWRFEIAKSRMPGTALTIWLVIARPIAPAPIIPTRTGRPLRSRSCSARSTMITAGLQPQAAPAAARRRPQAPDDALNGGSDAADEFRLGRGGKLIVQAAQRPLPVVEGQVALRHDRLQPVVGELVLTEGPREEPARVRARLELDDKRPFEVGLGEDHAATRLRQRSEESSRPDASRALR